MLGARGRPSQIVQVDRRPFYSREIEMILSAIAIFGLVFFVSIRVHNVAVILSGKIVRNEGVALDVALAVCATTLFVSLSL